MEFSRPARLRVAREARKLLQLAAPDLALHTDSDRIYGLVKNKNYDEREEYLFTIRFLGHYRWEVAHAEKILMRVKYGLPYLLKPPFDEYKLRKDLPRIFVKMTEKHITRIVELVREAEKQKHGTMLLITEAAKSESERLCTQATPICPKILTPELIRNLTTIDGAIILNSKGTCYAIGAILDGMANETGVLAGVPGITPLFATWGHPSIIA